MKEFDQTRDIAKRMYEALKADLDAMDGEDSAGALARGRVLKHAGYDAEAVAQFELAVRLDKTNYDAMARLILANIGQGATEKALEAAMQLAAQAPDYAMKETTSDEVISSFTLLGNALVKAGRNADAMDAYASAREKRPDDTTAAARLAQLHLASGSPDKALEQADVFRAVNAAAVTLF